MSNYSNININTQKHHGTLSINLITKLFIYFGSSSFILSLFLTSLFTSGEEIQGYWILITGWLGLVFFQLAWFANPINLLAILLINTYPKRSLLLSLIAFLLASQSFLFSEIPIGLHQEKIFIKEFGLGFYLWYLAQGIFLLVTFINAYESKNRV